MTFFMGAAIMFTATSIMLCHITHSVYKAIVRYRGYTALN